MKLIVVLFFLLSSCYTQIITEIYSIGNKDDAFFVSLTDMIIDSDNLYITDKGGYSLYKINSNGEIEKKIGRYGEGPNEFITGPNKIFKSDENIIVTDGNGNLLLNKFDCNLNFLKRIIFNHLITDVESYGKFIIMYHRYFDKDHFLFNYDCQLKNSKGINLHNISEFAPENDIKTIFSPDGRLIVTYKNRNIIEFFDKNFNYKNSIAIKEFRKKSEFKVHNSIKKMVEEKLPPKSAQFYINTPKHTIIKSLLIDNKNRLYIQGGTYSKELRKKVFIYNLSGKKIGEFEISDNEIITAIDKNNHLYTFAEDRTVLKKYKIKIND